MVIFSSEQRTEGIPKEFPEKEKEKESNKEKERTKEKEKETPLSFFFIHY